MTKLSLIGFTIAFLTAGFSLAGVLPWIVPQGCLALGLMLALLGLMNQPEAQRL
ncbi:MAG TPA: hypothetical protein VEQ65_04395 [Opitutus sp.]|nr:hypothetical protein [Opitutus sp.]